MKDRNWDDLIWRMATNPLILAATALLVLRDLTLKLQAGGSVEDVLLLQWFLPLVGTVSIAVAVVWWGQRQLWSLTRIVLFGTAAAMLAQPLIASYIRLLSQPI
ncbi:MAG TPA: hypothetical protein VGW38_05760 [Chloroflexota bacterium]|nr:hypothetical protein [Chloroflexota bacterium]